MKTLIIFPASAICLLAACETAPEPEPRVVTQEVRIPVPVACIDRAEIPAKPDYPDERLDGSEPLDVIVRALRISSERRQAHEPELYALLEACAQ